MKRTVHFKTNTLLKNLVGKDLINDDDIAVVELVKNAYDARAKSARVYFEDVSHPTSSRLIIIDDGSGMATEDIEDKWLNIAYSDKTLKPKEHGISFAGNKGVGRFSCDRLGEKLDLLTRKKQGTLLHLSIDWPSFEIEGQKDLTIQKIDVMLKEVDEAEASNLCGRPFPEHGTALIISGLRSVWDRDRLVGLKHTLERFLNPNQAFTRQSFTIFLHAEALAQEDRTLEYLYQVNGEIRNQIFSNLEFKSTFIEAIIDENGETFTSILSHEGEPVFRIVEKNPFSIKDVRAFIYYLNPYKKAYFKRQTGVRSIDFGSIFLFLNGFRVAPYGDRGNDWLGLDSRKSQGQTRYLANRDIIGRVEVYDNEDHFKPISSREGLKNTPQFIELKEDFVLDVVRRLEKFVVDGLDWDSIPQRLRNSLRNEQGLDWDKTAEEYAESWEKKRQRIALSLMSFITVSTDKIISFWFNPSLLEQLSERKAEEASKLLDDLEVFSPKQLDRNLRTTVKDFRTILQRKEEETQLAKGEAASLRVDAAKQNKKIKDLEEQTATFKAQTLFLQSVSSLDAKQLMAYHHEIALNSGIVENYLAKAVKAIREQTTTGVLPLLEKIALANKRITAIAQYATKANFKSASSREPTDIPSFIEQYINNVAKDFVGSGLQIDIQNDFQEAFEIKVRRLELSILVDNILSNAIKAQSNRVAVHLEPVGKNLMRATFTDDGRGLSGAIDRPDAIFELGVTTTSGSGLGLFHAKQIVEGIDGTIKAIPQRRGLSIVIEILR
jgi:signal transduction histidine kinase